MRECGGRSPLGSDGERRLRRPRSLTVAPRAGVGRARGSEAGVGGGGACEGRRGSAACRVKRFVDRPRYRTPRKSGVLDAPSPRRDGASLRSASSATDAVTTPPALVLREFTFDPLDRTIHTDVADQLAVERTDLQIRRVPVDAERRSPWAGTVSCESTYTSWPVAAVLGQVRRRNLGVVVDAEADRVRSPGGPGRWCADLFELRACSGTSTVRITRPSCRRATTLPVRSFQSNCRASADAASTAGIATPGCKC